MLCEFNTCIYYSVFQQKSNKMDKITVKSYECTQCKKMTTGYPALYRNKCLECRNLEMRSMINSDFLPSLKMELVLENKKS